MTRQPIHKVAPDQLQKDLERYRQRALELGAADAKIVAAETIKIDERVSAKCRYPRCAFYGTNANCPPYSMKPEEMHQVIRNFRYAVLVKIEIPSTETTGAEARNPTPHRRQLMEIIARLESEAFQDGYYLALALGSGSCKSLFCRDLECQALIPGKACRQALKSRSSMEAVGIDCFDLSTQVGWTIYPIGINTAAEEVPYGTRMGIVFID